MSSTATRRGTRLGDRKIRFRFDGREFEGLEGDTAASALLANGIRQVGRGVKSRRLRGIFTAGPEEPNALVTVGAAGGVIPNVPATQLVLTQGLELRSQNCWPTIRWDLASLALGLGHGLFSAGFYYKTFLWPSWRAFESVIRHLAGLGHAPTSCTLPQASVEHLNCDTLVAGGGPAGLLSALQAARNGQRVVLCEREPYCGGELEFERSQIQGQPSDQWLQAIVAELGRLGVRVLTNTSVVGNNDGRIVAHSEPGGLPGHNTLYHIRTATLAVATGAMERPIVFVNNDRPGVMLLSAAERFLARQGAKAGRSAVIFANHNRAYSAAQRLIAGGMPVRAIIDTRDENEFANGIDKLRNDLTLSGVECLAGHMVTAARGCSEVEGAEIAARNEPGKRRTIPCDTILTSGGWSPTLHAATHAGSPVVYCPEIAAFKPNGRTAFQYSRGAANGTLHLRAIFGEAAPQPTDSDVTGDPPPAVAAFWRSPAESADENRQYVDLQNDVTVADLRVAYEEGFTDIEHAKRYTALGFGTDQGRTGSLPGAAIFAELRGQPVSEIGLSRLRQPYYPVTLNSIAEFRVGAALRIARRTPLHEWHEANRGLLEPSGLWMRPRYYLTTGVDVASSALAEAAHVRTSVGIFDASTLGKFDICGPDAATFLDSVYLTKASSLAVGRTRYAVSLREDGMVLDDGLIVRLAPDRFYVTSGTGHANQFLSHLEFYRSTTCARMALAITDVSDAWAAIAVSGPKAREAIMRLVDEESREQVLALKKMNVLSATVGRQALRILGVSFSGEGYEIHCPSESAPSVWEQLTALGTRPYGLDALDILRVEKGFLTHAEMNGRTTPYDLGMLPFVKRDGDYVGRALLDRPAFHAPDRPRLVGVRACDGRSKFLGGAQIASTPSTRIPCGFVTSSVFSPTLGQWIGLALVARSIQEGAQLLARDPLRNCDAWVRVTSLNHLDSRSEPNS